MAKKAKKQNPMQKYLADNKLTTMTFYMSKVLHTKLKKQRAKTGESMNNIINRAIEKELKKAA